MGTSGLYKSSARARETKSCTDPIVGAILSGWRYDISNISPEMRTDYEQHLTECSNCRRRQTIARTFDVFLLVGTMLSVVAFLLAALVFHRFEQYVHISALHVHVHHTAVTISLMAVAVAGLLVSTVMCLLVAIATPIPSLITGVVQEQIPVIRQRFTRRAA